MKSILLDIKCRQCGGVTVLRVQEEDYHDWQDRKLYVQDAFPYLSASERELLVSQTCGPCFDKMFPDDDSDYDWSPEGA